jgi:Tfp pilus assembly protein FimT
MTKAYVKKREGKIKEAGFSVVEITIVILMIGIILAIAFPRISAAVQAYKLRSSADHIAERLSAVRALALAKNKSVTFSFNNSSGQYGFDFTSPSADGVPDTSDPENPSISYFTEGLPSYISATFPGNAPIIVTFNSRGELPIGSTDKYIVLTYNSKTVQVHVNLRGRVTVE